MITIYMITIDYSAQQTALPFTKTLRLAREHDCDSPHDWASLGDCSRSGRVPGERAPLGPGSVHRSQGSR